MNLGSIFSNSWLAKLLGIQVFIDGINALIDASSQTKYQTKVLSAEVTTTGVVAELGFSSLVIGNTYEIVGQVALRSGSTGGPTGTIKNGSDFLIGFQQDGSSSVEAIVNGISSGSFVATSANITFDMSAADGSNVVEGNGTKDASGTFLQLRELKGHVITTAH